MLATPVLRALPSANGNGNCLGTSLGRQDSNWRHHGGIRKGGSHLCREDISEPFLILSASSAMLPIGVPSCELGELVLTVVQALSETYSHYRPVKGDGNCGWRGNATLVPHTRCIYVLTHRAHLEVTRRYEPQDTMLLRFSLELTQYKHPHSNLGL